MGKEQGYKRLSAGYDRKFTNSELERGYLFITRDAVIRKILDNRGIELVVDGKSYGVRKIDQFGRVSPGNNFKQYISNKKHLTIKFYEDDLRVTVDTE